MKSVVSGALGLVGYLDKMAPLRYICFTDKAIVHDRRKVRAVYRVNPLAVSTSSLHDSTLLALNSLH